MRLIKLEGKKRIVFTVEGTNSEHKEVMEHLRQSEDLRNFEAATDRDSEQ
jgi:hypothetical protein